MKDIIPVCHCKKRMWREDLSMLLPCEHFIHTTCRKDLTDKECKICGTAVVEIVNESRIINIEESGRATAKAHQQYVDLSSIKGINKLGDLSLTKMFTSIPTFAYSLMSVIYSDGGRNMLKTIDDIFSDFRTKIIVNGDNLISTKNKVVIANHCNYIDPFVLHKVFGDNVRFIASSTVKKMPFGYKLEHDMPILFIDRGGSSNTVQQMTKFMEGDKNRSIAIFPEGMISHPKTLVKFRTGAFNTGFPVQPVVIRYKPYVYCDNVLKLFSYLYSQRKTLEITVDILPLVYPPFTPDKIERIRHSMAKVGNFAISRVINKGIIDP